MKKFIENWLVAIGLTLFTVIVIINFSCNKKSEHGPTPDDIDIMELLRLQPDETVASQSKVLPYVTPDQYGAVRASQTLEQLGKDQAYCNATYPGLNVTPKTMADAAAWRKALKKSAETGKMIIAFGFYEFGLDSAPMPKYFRSITIYGGAYIHCSGNSGSPVITRPRPVDNNDANVMINAFLNIDGLQIGNQDGGQVNRIGIDIGPTYNSVYKKVDCFSLQEAIHLRFALNTSIDMCEAQYCIKGWTADIGNWPGAGTANSQSNVTTFDHCRFNATSNSDYAFGIYASSGVVMRDNIIEGDKVRVGVDYDAKNSTVVKSGAAYNTHFECVNGATEACFKLKIAGGIWVIDGVFGQHAAVMVDGYSYGGNSVIEVTHSVYWVPSPTGKYFKNSGCAWTLRCNGNLLFDSGDAVNKFSGTPVTYCNQPNKCSANTVTVEWVAN